MTHCEASVFRISELVFEKDFKLFAKELSILRMRSSMMMATLVITIFIWRIIFSTQEIESTRALDLRILSTHYHFFAIHFLTS